MPHAQPAAARSGSTPGRAAPAIPAAVWDEADELYRDTAALWNEGQTARNQGESAEYQKKVLEAWDVLEKLYAKIEPYTDWYEEADLEGWAMPSDYGRLERRLGEWDALRTKVRKMKPMKQRR